MVVHSIFHSHFKFRHQTKQAAASVPLFFLVSNPNQVVSMFSNSSKKKYLSNRPSQNLLKMDDDENQFVVEDISKAVRDIIEVILGTTFYDHDKVDKWSSTVSEQCLSALSKLKKSFKYVVTCSIMQKVGAGLHTASSCYWDSQTDGTCTVRWENPTMYCIVTVFGLAIWEHFTCIKNWQYINSFKILLRS